jgi:hypothetical protein
MAQKVHVVLVDDLDQGEADETITFGLDGTNYEIDLSAENADNLRAALAQYVGVARKAAGSSRSTRARRTSSRVDSDTARIREWARSEGIPVSDRGRIKADIRERYYAAH